MDIAPSALNLNFRVEVSCLIWFHPPDFMSEPEDKPLAQGSPHDQLEAATVF